MSSQAAPIDMYLRSLCLTGLGREYVRLADVATTEHWSYEEYLSHVLEVETVERHGRRIARLLKASHLPDGKTLATLEREKLPASARAQCARLLEEPSSLKRRTFWSLGSRGSEKRILSPLWVGN